MESSYEKGLDVYKSYGGSEAIEKFLSGFARENPELARWTVEFAYAQAMNSPLATWAEKAAINTTALAAVGSDYAPALKAALREGLDIIGEDKVKCTLNLVTVYRGFPLAIQGSAALSEVLAEKKPRPAQAPLRRRPPSP